MTDVILDISRLISRIRHSTPSGVDRVEMAYARGLQSRFGDSLTFAAVHPFGPYGRVRNRTAIAYLDELEQRWARADDEPDKRSLPSVLPWLAALLPTRRGVGRAESVYIQASPHHLVQQRKVRRILTRERARFLCLIHDLIPIEFPEYARPAGAALHARRMETVAALADGVILNSEATGRSFQPWIARSGRTIAQYVALLGTEPLASAEPSPGGDTGAGQTPYFVCLGTIEPRKNHLLLLHLWRHMAETMPAAQIPRLILIGRRGWENEQVIDMLDRCTALNGLVEEINGCSDTRMATLLRGSRALLLPSFAEGYGMPVAEALSVGVPVICSDLPALREAGGGVPDYLDPLDGPGWQAAILDHAANGPMQAAQKWRLSGWRAPDWESHIAIVARAVDDLRNGVGKG